MPDNDLQLRTYENRDLAEALVFISLHPWLTRWPENLLVQFLNDYVSSPHLIFDVHESQRRVAFGVLIDKVQNPANDANLEILAVKEVRPEKIFDLLIPVAQARLPLARSGFSLGFPASFTPAETISKRHGLLPNYEMYEMLNLCPEKFAKSAENEFFLSAEKDEAEIYHTLKICFHANPDTSIPNFNDWAAGRARNKNRRTWLRQLDGKIMAFLNLVFSETEAEISSLGVLPQHRGMGYARGLIAHALGQLPSLGLSRCKLSVAVQNQRALDLYKGLGFQPTDHHLIFRWERRT